MIRTLAPVALAMSIVWASPAIAQEASVTHAYDVRALTTVCSDLPGPLLGFDEPFVGQMGSLDMEGGDVTIDALHSLILDNVEPGTWEGERRISARDGVLVVSAPPEVHAKIGSLLAWIRARQAAQVVLEVRVHEGPAAAAEGMLSGGSVLDPERVAALGGAPWTSVRASRIVSVSGQRQHVARTAVRAYLGDYDVEVADKAHGWDPTVGELLTGEVADTTATIANGGHGLLVGVRHESCTSVMPMAVFALGMRTAAGKPIPPVELPRTRTWRLRNSLWMPVGGSAIAGATRTGDIVQIVVVRHVPRPVELPPPPTGDGKRTTRLFDTRYATYTPPDYVAPRLGVTRAPDAGGGGVGGAIFDTGEEGVRLSTDELIELVKSRIDPESWEHERNRIATVGGQLVVTQTSDVLEQLATYLTDLERLRSVSLFVRAQVLEAADDETGAELLALVGEELAAAPTAALVERIAAGRGVTVVADTATSVMPGQRVYAATFASEAFVKDHALNIATASARFDPEISSLRHGTVLSIRPALLQTDQKVMLDLTLSETNLVGMPARDTGDGHRIIVPALESGERRLTTVLAFGGTALVDLGRRRFARVTVHVSRPAPDRDK